MPEQDHGAWRPFQRPDREHVVVPLLNPVHRLARAREDDLAAPITEAATRGERETLEGTPTEDVQWRPWWKRFALIMRLSAFGALAMPICELADLLRRQRDSQSRPFVPSQVEIEDDR